MIWPFKAKKTEPVHLGRGLLRGEDAEQVSKALAMADLVIREYAAVLAKSTQPLQPESALAHRKEIIRDSLRVDALQHAGDEQYLGLLKANLVLLANFRPDAELDGVYWVDAATSPDDLDDAKTVGLLKAVAALKESQREHLALQAWWEVTVEEPITAAKPGRSS